MGVRAQQGEPFPTSMYLSALTGTNGFVLNGEQANDRSGYSVASAGDVNGDGVADLVIGAFEANSNAGKSYVVFGSRGLGSGGSLALSNLDGTNGFVLNGKAGDASGHSVASAGDVNSDGIADLVIGAHDATSSAGKSYVIFGRKMLGISGSLALSNLNGTNGFVLNGEIRGDQSGYSVANAGDVNGDGIDDLVIGANGATSHAGKGYVVFGRAGLGISGSLALSSLDGTDGFCLNGEKAFDQSGNSVASAGDVNGDGISDLVVGAVETSGLTAARGKSYVVFGRRGLGSSGSLALSSLNGTSGFILHGEMPGDYSGISVASAGDVNGDGIADLVIGAYGANNDAGKSYVIFGRKGLGSSGKLTLSGLNGTNGFVLNGEFAQDKSGYSVASAGDMNGDGIADLVIGAYGANTNAGKSYVVFGKAGLGSSGSLTLASLDKTSGFVLNGDQAYIQQYDLSGFSVASAGDVNGDGIVDLMIGAQGANSFTGNSYVVFGRRINPFSQNESFPNSTGRFPSLLIGVAAAVTALACSLIAGGLFYFRKKRTSKNFIEKEAELKGNSALYAAFDSIEAIQQDRRPQPKEDEHDDQVSLLS